MKRSDRHGLPETGGRVQTIEALNAPVAVRLRQPGSLDRLNGMGFTFGQRYVVVNIPAAVAEAIADGKVTRRYVTVVGKVDRPSPTLTTQISAVNLNPTWTVPLSILKKDIVTKMRKDPNYIGRMKMRVLDGNGNEVDARAVDWHSDRTPNFTVRQDSGNGNALGNVRIDMPNPHSVYMHDTNHKEFFSADYRFQSSGCTRVEGVRDFAAWILKDNEGWDRKEIDAEIATAKRTTVRLARGIPVAGSTSPVGRARTARSTSATTSTISIRCRRSSSWSMSGGRWKVSSARASGFVLQSNDARRSGRCPIWIASRFQGNFRRHRGVFRATSQENDDGSSTPNNTRGGDADGPRKPPKTAHETRRKKLPGRARRQLPGLRSAHHHPADQARTTGAEEAHVGLTFAPPLPISGGQAGGGKCRRRPPRSSGRAKSSSSTNSRRGSRTPSRPRTRRPPPSRCITSSRRSAEAVPCRCRTGSILSVNWL